MSIYYPSGCDDDLLEHNCDPCPAGEHGRVRGVAFVKKTFDFTDITDPTEWEAGIAAGDIVIIPETNGTYDGGTPQFGPGYGDTPERYLGSEFKVNYRDPNYIGNCDFYNKIRKSRNWKIAYLSETQIRLSTGTATVFGKDAIADDLNSEIVWEVEAKFKQTDTSCPSDIPDGIFRCFDVI
jgi:hypothetical protein